MAVVMVGMVVDMGGKVAAMGGTTTGAGDERSYYSKNPVVLNR
jgi:hypothetical protein